MEDLHSGLEDISVAETRLSSIDGETGELFIGGFPIEELAANATYEETVFLLLNDRPPTVEELKAFRSELASHRAIVEETRAVLRRAANEEKPPMDALRMGLSAASLGVENETTETAVRRVIAVVPTIVSTYWRYREGKDSVTPRNDLRHAENYLYMMTGDEPTEAAVRGLETYLNTVIDHGLNASTFTARVVVSSESDVVSAATAAVGTLKGPLHGGAPGPVLETLEEVYETGSPEEYVQSKLDAGERLMGFGHRVYRVRDPRAEVLSTAAEQFYDAGGDAEFFAATKTFEDVATDLLAEHKPERRLETNVEFYTAVLLAGVGVPKGLFTTTFAVARVGGWMAHALEQLDDNKLIRPRGRYTGRTDRRWKPIDDR